MSTADDQGAPGPDSPGRRLVAAVAAGTIALLAVVGATVVARDDGSPASGQPGPGQVRRPGDPGPSAPGPLPSASGPTDTTVASPARPARTDAEALGQVLASRALALRERDRTAWLAPVDPSATDLAATESVAWDRLTAVPFTSYRYVVRGTAGRALVPAPAGAWSVAVDLAYRLPGDARDVLRALVATAVRRDGQVRLLDLRAAPTQGTPVRDLWDLADVSVRTQGRALVIAATSDTRALRRYAAAVDASARRVDEVWGRDWRRVVVVVVPGSVQQMATVLGRAGPAGLDQIAAVTTGEIDRQDGTAATTADRVVLNPDQFGVDGDPLLRGIVLTHELTHVATRGSVLVGPPLWVEEGFADWVAYRGSGLTRQQVAAELFRRVRAGTGPTRLPTQEDFDPAFHDVDGAYAGAWLAFDLVEHRDGADAAVDFYRTAAGLSGVRPGDEQTRGAALARAFRLLGTDEAGFTRRWTNRLDALAGADR